MLKQDSGSGLKNVFIFFYTINIYIKLFRQISQKQIFQLPYNSRTLHPPMSATFNGNVDEGRQKNTK